MKSSCGLGVWVKNGPGIEFDFRGKSYRFPTSWYSVIFRCQRKFHTNTVYFAKCVRPEIWESVIFIYFLQCKHLRTLKRFHAFATWKSCIKKNYQGPIAFTSKQKFADENSNWWTWKKLLRESYTLMKKCKMVSVFT